MIFHVSILICLLVDLLRQKIIGRPKNEVYNFIESASQYIKNKNMFISFSGEKSSTMCVDSVACVLANSKVVHIFGDTTIEFGITYDYVNRFIKNHPQTIFKTTKNTE